MNESRRLFASPTLLNSVAHFAYAVVDIVHTESKGKKLLLCWCCCCCCTRLAKIYTLRLNLFYIISSRKCKISQHSTHNKVANKRAMPPHTHTYIGFEWCVRSGYFFTQQTTQAVTHLPFNVIHLHSYTVL